MFKKKNCLYLTVTALIIFLIPSVSFSSEFMGKYGVCYSLGVRATYVAAALTGNEPGIGLPVVLTNAGYAELNGSSTEGCLDGLKEITHATRGKNTLLEIHSRYDDALWFAVYYPGNGMCAYMEVNPDAVPKLFANVDSGSYYQIAVDINAVELSELFSIMSAENIKPENLYADTAFYDDKFNTQKVFGKNAFRVVTIANAAAYGAPHYAVKAFEFHDHYCPGITSGIMMASYIKKNFPRTSYFVQGINPWCKEDALMVILNATPGKSGYAVTYPTAEDTAKWKEGFEGAATIIYGQNKTTDKWEGKLLSFTWAEGVCSEYSVSIINKLCMDLYYIDHLNEPELYVKVLKEFELPEGETPKDWARPGVDPMKKLGLVEE